MGEAKETRKNRKEESKQSKQTSKKNKVKTHNFIRGMWATRQMEDIGHDKELEIRITLRELVVFVVFLFILCFVAFGMTSPNSFYFTEVMTDLFLDGGDDGISFYDIASYPQIWEYIKTTLMNGLFWDDSSLANITRPDQRFILHENKLLGVARLRQVRMSNHSCEIHEHFEDHIKSCHGPYEESKEDKAPFGQKTLDGWFYQTKEELDGHTVHVRGIVASYGGGGYARNLGRDATSSKLLIQHLEEHFWIDRSTRAIFIDFTVYNANVNLFCVVRLTLEIPATGGVVPSHNFRTVKLLRYVTDFDYFILGTECIFLLFVLYYLIEEILEINHMRMEYFRYFWNCLDVFVVSIAIICICFNIYRTIAVANILQSLLSDPHKHPDFEFLSFYQSQYNNAMAITVFITWIKIFKYISFNKTMGQLWDTISRCARDLVGFFIMFSIVFMAFTQLGFLLFGRQLNDFATLYASMFTLFRTILGDFDYNQLERANRVMGPIFFLLYIFFVFFVLLNMFLAIINETYSEVKAEVDEEGFQVLDYFKLGILNLTSKIGIGMRQQAKLKEQLALASDNLLEPSTAKEFKENMIERGFKEKDVERVLEKHHIKDDDKLRIEEEQKLLREIKDMEVVHDVQYDTQHDDMIKMQKKITYLEKALGDMANNMKYGQLEFPQRKVKKRKSKYSSSCVCTTTDPGTPKTSLTSESKSVQRKVKKIPASKVVQNKWKDVLDNIPTPSNTTPISLNKPEPVGKPFTEKELDLLYGPLRGNQQQGNKSLNARHEGNFATNAGFEGDSMGSGDMISIIDSDELTSARGLSRKMNEEQVKHTFPEWHQTYDDISLDPAGTSSVTLDLSDTNVISETSFINSQSRFSAATDISSMFSTTSNASTVISKQSKLFGQHAVTEESGVPWTSDDQESTIPGHSSQGQFTDNSTETSMKDSSHGNSLFSD